MNIHTPISSKSSRSDNWTRGDILPEYGTDVLDGALGDALGLGQKLAQSVSIGSSPFYDQHNVRSEIAFKKRCVETGVVMVHAQIGFRDLEKSRRAYDKIHHCVSRDGGRIDRYGICLDWSMGYPIGERQGRSKGTGLILHDPAEFQQLTSCAPVAPHFGDFVLGMPAALENTAAALGAGSTAIGNIGQYFTFRLPNWHDDVTTTKATVAALALCAAQPEPILIHSNLDDGFAALFTDLSCALGAVLLERHIVETLLGCQLGHCYGHTFSNPVSRWGFQRALARLGGGPGTMVYGNTTSYGSSEAMNYAALAGYLGIDITAQRDTPSGHAINPVPVSEAKRIPDIDEIIDANLFAARMIEDAPASRPLYDCGPADALADKLVDGAHIFYERVMAALDERGIDTTNALEMLLSLKRLGARRLEALYGPGQPDNDTPSGRRPIVETPVIGELDSMAKAVLNNAKNDVSIIAGKNLRVCVATTDVHEYGKVVVERVLRDSCVKIIDGGVSTDPDFLAQTAHDHNVHAIAISTYNGIALDFIERLRDELDSRNFDIPVFIGGKLNQIPADSNSSLPVDVSADIEAKGAITCQDVETMLTRLADIATSSSA